MQESRHPKNVTNRPNPHAWLVKLALIAILVIGIAAVTIDFSDSKDQPNPAGGQAPLTALPAGTNPLPAATGALPGQTPEPWYFDSVNNQHWHAEHGHWHPGPPPAPADRVAAAPAPVQIPPPVNTGAATPEPWFFDAANNQHWHPAHAHWHPGPPPPVAERQ